MKRLIVVSDLLTLGWNALPVPLIHLGRERDPMRVIYLDQNSAKIRVTSLDPRCSILLRCPREVLGGDCEPPSVTSPFTVGSRFDRARTPRD